MAITYTIADDANTVLGPPQATPSDLNRLDREMNAEWWKKQERIEKPTLPPGQDIDAKIEKAKEMNLLTWIKHVVNGGQWDYKKQTSHLRPNPLEGPGNMNYGATGRAIGFSEDILKMAGGAYQIYTGKSKEEWGGPSKFFKASISPSAFFSAPKLFAPYLAAKYKGVFLSPYHGDEPIDQINIENGSKYYEQHQKDQEQNNTNNTQ